MLTLWDLIEPILKGRGRKKAADAAQRSAPAAGETPAPVVVVQKRPARRKSSGSTTPQAPRVQGVESAQERYDRIVSEQLARYEIRVRKWRTSMSGIAWYVTYKDGRVSRLIESPRPKGPMSMAVFLHEVGHHAIGFNVHKPRCLEEYHAWAWSLARMEEFELNITDAVRHRMHLSLWYAVAKAKRRGIKSVPEELMPYVERPVKKGTKAGR